MGRKRNLGGITGVREGESCGEADMIKMHCTMYMSLKEDAKAISEAGFLSVEALSDC